MALVPRLEMDTVQTKMALGSRPEVFAGTLFSTVLSSLDPRWRQDRGELGRNNCILRQREIAFAFLPLFKKRPFPFLPRFLAGNEISDSFPVLICIRDTSGSFSLPLSVLLATLSGNLYVRWHQERCWEQRGKFCHLRRQNEANSLTSFGLLIRIFARDKPEIKTRSRIRNEKAPLLFRVTVYCCAHEK